MARDVELYYDGEDKMSPPKGGITMQHVRRLLTLVLLITCLTLVPEVVQAQAGESGLADRRLPDPVTEVVDLQRGAFRRGEHERAALAR